MEAKGSTAATSSNGFGRRTLLSILLVIVPAIGSSCAARVETDSRPQTALETLVRNSGQPRVGKDVWEIFMCRIPEIHDVDLYDMSGVRLAESSEWITSQLERVGDYFERWSNGRYMVEFRAGGEIEVSVGASEECVDAALEKSARDVHGVLVVADAQHRENRVGGWGRKGHECEHPCSASESKRAIYLGAADFVSGSPVVLDLVEHEFGHALDWPHSYRTDPYDSVIDVMSDSAAPRRNGGSSIHAPGVLAINRYLSGWMDHEPLLLDAAAKAKFEIDDTTFAISKSADARAVSVEIIGDF
jgi:hypothetical protein